MTNWLFQIVPTTHVAPPAAGSVSTGLGEAARHFRRKKVFIIQETSDHPRHSRFLNVFLGALLILGMLAALMFVNSIDVKLSPAHAHAAPLVMYP